MTLPNEIRNQMQAAGIAAFSGGVSG